MKVIRHDDERVQKESSLASIVEDGSLKQFRGGGHPEEAAALRRDCGDKIRTSFLRCESHIGRINERPVAKATFNAEFYSGA